MNKQELVNKLIEKDDTLSKYMLMKLSKTDLLKMYNYTYDKEMSIANNNYVNELDQTRIKAKKAYLTCGQATIYNNFVVINNITYNGITEKEIEQWKNEIGNN